MKINEMSCPYCGETINIVEDNCKCCGASFIDVINIHSSDIGVLRHLNVESSTVHVVNNIQSENKESSIPNHGNSKVLLFLVITVLCVVGGVCYYYFNYDYDDRYYTSDYSDLESDNDKYYTKNGAIYGTEYDFLSERLLSEEDVALMSKHYRDIYRNSIYARYGNIFSNEEYSNFFKTKKWYVGQRDVSKTELTEIEKANVEILYKANLTDKQAVGKTNVKTTEKKVNAYSSMNVGDGALISFSEVKMIDLGLSVEWAICNIGAKTETEFGSYYTLKQMKNITLEAREKGYDLPTQSDFEELTKRCTWERVVVGNNVLMRITGPNGQSIYLPASGCLSNNEQLAEGTGSYWLVNGDRAFFNGDVYRYFDSNSAFSVVIRLIKR